jgi:hypothetical protein
VQLFLEESPVPYSGPNDPNLPSSVQAMDEDDREQWVAIWNDVYAGCREEGGSVDDCETAAFQAANGAMREESRMAPNHNLLRRAWNQIFDLLAGANYSRRFANSFAEGFSEGVSDGWSDSLAGTAQAPMAHPVARALGMRRLSDQLWEALNGSGDDLMPSEWAWPLDVYVDGSDLFAIYAQGGKLYRVDLAVSDDSLVIGEPVQVTEAFPPITQQARFYVRRQADGRHRWLMIAATAVLNRVGEIDSTELFDSFVAHAADTGQYPRLDFYHLGSADPTAWEFGVADYLARDGVCYIASGLFDEDHPLARAVIAAAERDPGKWGASIEFRALGQTELILANPEVRIPVYRRGINTRISVVREADAAGLFTTLAVSKEVLRMRQEILEALADLYGNEEEARAFLEQFGQDVDRVNRTVEDEGLVYRTQEDAAPSAEADAPASGPPAEIELDDAAVAAIAEQVAQHPVVTQLATTIAQLQTQVETLTQAETQRTAKFDALLARLEQRLAAVERSDEDKQREWQADLPAARTKVTYRPRDAYHGDDEDNAADYAAIAEQTIKEHKLPAY